MGKEVMEQGRKQLIPLSTYIIVIFTLWWTHQQNISEMRETNAILASELRASIEVLQSVDERVCSLEDTKNEHNVMLAEVRQQLKGLAEALRNL